ncbi:hypothetical protein SNK03_006364 [Fusarium graminearum]|uniref:Chromosome 2, complete genome n=1 Tax=Gibberella zeae (strain ATCC MYA-4620 / CBS 123657 / FGSC 9075 / NRRL 31084 / PH-1) TaxID=229533 RepID=I1RIM0_GIBZE|nr:hypothetical protein FGSG_03658 [Fusarium graminearum PH-1]EYB32776.1 hypothetical protein FG05_03658 [Fusarium graminearum]ESU09542.1 hypothetical protein FGSG_03658 [Fusarium graminearum PH-1]KAI6774304.1 hypothetical protein HG531_001153 [Fusarium graminearum]CAF3469606.1 unnamed protein product [Fusarium graminearum]CAF3503967.1 unnamed protein product [Fusarium graminearum]|eukprot:XP_011322041.1 hypothetical protein FGSG_03658 [Fusarium graminearum PH-1]
MSSKPTIVLATGAWHFSSCYDDLRKELHNRGWKTDTVDYPSVGAEPPTKGLDEDAAALRSVLQRLADDGEQIVLVVHSYGGLVGANAVKGLGYRQRREQGLPGGVIMYVYMAAFVAPVGTCIKQMLGGEYLPWMMVDGGNIRVENPTEIFYHDVSGQALTKSLETLAPQSAHIFDGVVTNEPWHDIATMYFACTEDKAIPIAVQDNMAATLGPDALHYRIDASHSPFLSKIDETVKGLEYAAEEGVKKVAVA